MTTRRASDTLDALLHGNATIYADDIVTPQLTTPSPANTPLSPTYVSILSTNRLLDSSPMSTTSQGTYVLPQHAVETIQSIISYHVPPQLDARLHNFQWFLIGQGPHPRRTVFIPPSPAYQTLTTPAPTHNPASYVAPRAYQTNRHLERLENWFTPPTSTAGAVVDEDYPLPIPLCNHPDLAHESTDEVG